MAKKQVEKKVTKDVTTSIETQVLKLTCEVKAQAELILQLTEEAGVREIEIIKLNQRIDKIVIAHTKCKSLKGL